MVWDKPFATLALIAAPLALAAEPELVAPPPMVGPSADAPCLVCRGSGKEQTEDRGIRSETASKKTVFTLTCRTCSGRGRFTRPLRPDERIERQRTTWQTFTREQLALGRIPVGAAYAERGSTDALAPEDYARLAQRYPKRCAACFGLGFEPCRKCKGSGEILERPRDASAKAKPEEIAVGCPECSSTGKVPCKKCAGEGLAPLCKRCNGTGVADVKAKKNLPAHTERCKTCRGEGRR